MPATAATYATSAMSACAWPRRVGLRPGMSVS
jgi:hypothetical protein